MSIFRGVGPGLLPHTKFVKLHRIPFIRHKTSGNMNRKQRKNLIIALSILAGIVAALTMVAQLTG